MAQPPTHGTPPAIPRWVKVFGIVTIILIMLVVIMLLIGGDHGPGRHVGFWDTESQRALLAHGGRVS